jgi:hypothetical protein
LTGRSLFGSIFLKYNKPATVPPMKMYSANIASLSNTNVSSITKQIKLANAFLLLLYHSLIKKYDIIYAYLP